MMFFMAEHMSHACTLIKSKIQISAIIKDSFKSFDSFL